MYERQYFQLETCTNIKGCPTFLNVETNAGKDFNADTVQIPPYVNVLRDVTRDDYYATSNIAR